jgi:anti-sigma regulatory factor (Ser/Thr protein kinase)
VDDVVSRPLRFDLRLPASPIAVAAARAVVRAFQRLVDEESLQRVELVVSELVTNAVRHGSPPGSTDIGLELVIADGLLRGVVSDNGPCFDMPNTRPADGQLGGFGLLIVDDLSESLVIDRAATGNVVRFSIAIDLRPPDQ